MSSVTIYNQEKISTGSIELPSSIFGVEVRPEIINLVVRSIRASRRSGTHATKTRAFVSGGGAKPWKQKGTGRARAGSNRSPLWRGGAIIFGPQPRDYSFKVNKKVKALAMKMALSSRVQSENIFVLDTITLPKISTKAFVEIVKRFELGTALIVDAVDANHNTTLALSSRNIPGVLYTTTDKLNVYEIIKHKHLVLTQKAIIALQERFAE